MEVHRQQCQNCKSIDVRNILVRDTEHQTKVFVRCGNCKELVAYYEVARYYHHGKELESYLRAQGAGGESGRQWLADFHAMQEKATTGYEAALEKLDADNKSI